MNFHTGLSRDGPGVLVRDLLANPENPDLASVAALRPDIAVFQNVDYDFDRVALGLIQKSLSLMGHPMPHAYTTRPNTGVDSGYDLDRNGKRGEPRDMLGYGRFTGQGGMALLSRFPVEAGTARNLTDMLWRDASQQGPPANGYFTPGELAVLPLHSVSAWDVTVHTPNGPLRILTSHASTPAFDGPEDRNGLRNAAELQFWESYIAQVEDEQVPFVLMGTLNNDPMAGEGHKQAIENLLNHPSLQDPRPTHAGEPETALWANGLSLRVDYVLPSHGLGVRAAAVEWAPQSPEGSRHYPIWVDVVWQ
ncbi:endonuclease/exonuclease/phosphatase family protein [Litoreibacter janthinus]|nr:endonuclease/exonuclease/phosphatase family protein [Litoreibacter janthinus]